MGPKNDFKKEKREPVAFVKSTDERKRTLTDSSSINCMSYISQFSKKEQTWCIRWMEAAIQRQEAATDGALKKT